MEAAMGQLEKSKESLAGGLFYVDESGVLQLLFPAEYEKTEVRKVKETRGRSTTPAPDNYSLRSRLVVITAESGSIFCRFLVVCT